MASGQAALPPPLKFVESLEFSYRERHKSKKTCSGDSDPRARKPMANVEIIEGEFYFHAL